MLFRLYISTAIACLIILMAPVLLLQDIEAKEATPAPYKAVVHWIKDGDSLIVRVGDDKRELRLAGIDCPEYKQAFGQDALRLVIKTAKKKTVTVTSVEKDRYGRWVSWVKLPDGTLLNHRLLKAGLAWWYRKYYPHDKELEAMEQKARKAKLGLWAQDNPLPPWVWRMENARE